MGIPVRSYVRVVEKWEVLRAALEARGSSLAQREWEYVGEEESGHWAPTGFRTYVGGLAVFLTVYRGDLGDLASEPRWRAIVDGVYLSSQVLPVEDAVESLLKALPKMLRNTGRAVLRLAQSLVSGSEIPKVICLCGSTRFRPEFEDATRRITVECNIFLTVGFFGHSGDVVTDEQKESLDDLHLRKIDIADEVWVVHRDRYVGESTSREIEYARENGKKVVWYDTRTEVVL